MFVATVARNMQPVFSTASWCFPKPLRGFCITPTQTGTGFKLQPDGGLLPLFFSKGIKGAIWQRGGKWSCGSLNGPEVSAQRRNCNCESVKEHVRMMAIKLRFPWSVKSKTNNLSQALSVCAVFTHKPRFSFQITHPLLRKHNSRTCLTRRSNATVYALEACVFI